MANIVGGRKLSKGRIMLLIACAIPLAIGSFFLLNSAIDGSPRSDTFGPGVSEQCVEDTARIADEQAAEVAELGANAPITGFRFPESCFE